MKSFFRDIYNVLRRELWLIWHQPIHITLMVILPIVALSFFAIFFSKGVTRDVPIAVIDHDNTTTSRKLIDMIDATPTASIRFKVQDLLEAERKVKEGKIQAVVSIPLNFEKDIMGTTQTGVDVYINGVNMTVNGLLYKDIQTVITTFSTGVQLEMLTKQGMTPEQAQMAAMPIYFDRHVLFNPYINYGYYLLPSFMPMMIMIFAILLTIFAIGTELKNSTAGEWFRTANYSTFAAVIGKLLPYTVSMFMTVLFMNTITYKWIGVPLNGDIIVLTLGGFMFVMAYQSIGVLIITILSNLRMSLSIGGGYSVLAFSFSGLTFPRSAMDPMVQKLSYIFPFTFYTDIFTDQSMRAAPIIHSVEYMFILALFILLPVLAFPRLKKIATHEQYWGRL